MASIVAGLFLGKKTFIKRAKKSRLPSFKGVIEIKHTLNGRIRLYVPKLIGNEVEKDMLLSQMIRMKSVEHIEVNTLTGSILLHYNPTEIEPIILISVIIKLMGLEENLDKNEKSKISKEIQQFGNALNRSFYENTQGIVDLKTLLPLMLIFWGAKKIVIDKNNTTPGPYNLFWWGYNLLRKG